MLAINRAREWYEQNREMCSYDEGELCRRVLTNITGFELNPLAVMASRTNYLIAIRDLLGYVDKVEIPVYLCDAIMTPSQHGGLFAGTTESAKELKTSAGTFLIPTEIARDRETITTYAGVLESCTRNKYSASEFIERCEDEDLPVTERPLHEQLYEELCRLDTDGKNGIWARIIKNSFAPLFLPRQDFIVGNPPWVNWESLPKDYRNSTKPLWSRYGLFTLKGHEARLGGGKKDLSMLFVYVGVDNYLKDKGVLGFVITQTLFKSRQAGEGFRRFAFETDGRVKHIVPTSVVDMTDMRPFAGATNRTAAFLCKPSGSPIGYPLKYESWHPKEGGRTAEDASLASVLKGRRIRKMVAVPMIEGAPRSAWMTTPRDTLTAMRKVAGDTQVKARAGVCTWLNGVFWLRSVERGKGKNAVVTNWHDVGKKKVREVQASVEASLVHPLRQGPDLHPRRDRSLDRHPAHSGSGDFGVAARTSTMKRKYPRAYEYLRGCEKAASAGFGQPVQALLPIRERGSLLEHLQRLYGVRFASSNRVQGMCTDFFQCAVLDHARWRGH